MAHQFSLFGFQRPVGKVPISKQKVRNIKRAIEHKQAQAALTMLRELREGLEQFERKIKTKNQ